MALSVDIQKQLGGFRLQIQFEAEEERLALLGASGCGKSVTLRCIAGIMTPDEGKIVLDGITLFDSAAKISLPPQRRRVGYLFQQYALFPNMTVAQNIAAAVRDRGKRERVSSELLRRFQLERVADQRSGQLSGCKNFTDAVPQGDRVFLTEWDLTLDCGRPVSPGVRRMGVRAHFVHAARPGELNAFPCAVARVVDDVFTTIVLLHPRGAARDAPPLRMELDKAAWRALEEKEEFTAAIAPRDILLFEE